MEPLVSVLTPVYNGGAFLAECVESVLAQDYANWEYLIVDNCSNDSTAEIAKAYARKDHRIRVHTNRTFLNVGGNHNNAFSLISSESQYAKVVSADDWIEPRCLSTLVRFAMRHQEVGIISSYQRSGERFRWRELPETVQVLSGRDACRLALLTGAQIFGAPTAFLYRSDLLRRERPFFPNSRPHADTSACYQALQYCDFGVVHEVLSTERVHSGQVSSTVEELGGGTVAYLEVFLEYGPTYLTQEEFDARYEAVMKRYYAYLGGSLLKLKPRSFWTFQANRLQNIGLRLDWGCVARCAMREALAEARRPTIAAGKALAAIGGRLGGSPAPPQLF